MFAHTGVPIPQAILRPPHFHSFAQFAAPPIKGGIRSRNHRSRARVWSLSCAQTSADASQDSTANVMAGWGLAKVNRADWRPIGSAAARLAQNLQWRHAAKRKTVLGAGTIFFLPAAAHRLPNSSVNIKSASFDWQ